MDFQFSDKGENTDSEDTSDFRFGSTHGAPAYQLEKYFKSAATTRKRASILEFFNLLKGMGNIELAGLVDAVKKKGDSFAFADLMKCLYAAAQDAGFKEIEKLEVLLNHSVRPQRDPLCEVIELKFVSTKGPFLHGRHREAKKLYGNDNNPQPHDIHQGLIGTCHFLSHLIIASKTDPVHIVKQLIRPIGDNLYKVVFHRFADEKTTEPCEYIVDDCLLTSADGGLICARPVKGISWVPILEKAYACFTEDFGKNGSCLKGNYLYESMKNSGYETANGNRNPGLICRVLYGDRFVSFEECFMYEKYEESLHDSPKVKEERKQAIGERGNTVTKALWKAFSPNCNDGNLYFLTCSRTNKKQGSPWTDVSGMLDVEHVYAVISAKLLTADGHPAESIGDVCLKTSTVTIRNPHGGNDEEKPAEFTMPVIGWMQAIPTLSVATVRKK